MDATGQEQSARSRCIPPEIIEEILLNLPVKSLVRFSTVSKLWNSMIFDPKFARKHKNRAALRRRHRIVINAIAGARVSSLCDIPIETDIDSDYSGVARFYTISPEQPTAVAVDPVGEFKRETFVRAFCDELWCVEVDKSLFLWNPCMRSYKKVPNPLFACRKFTGINDVLLGMNSFAEKFDFIYGLGYDSVGNDYKILKIGKDRGKWRECELYSLKNNCWKRIKPFPSIPIWFQDRCEFLHGILHWVGGHPTPSSPKTIVSFNLSTEKYATLMLPEAKDFHFFRFEEDLQVVAVRGMLCVYMSVYDETKLLIWVMEEYGVEQSWTKKFDIQYGTFPYLPDF